MNGLGVVTHHQQKPSLGSRRLASRLTVANARIQPLQDAEDLDMATEAERAQLTAWKKYRVLLNRVDISSAPDIDWPDPPSEANLQNHGFKTVIHGHPDGGVIDQMG